MRKLKKKEKLIGSAILCGALAFFTLIGFIMNTKREAPIDEDIFIETSEQVSQKSIEGVVSAPEEERDIRVEIKGEVLKPDVYVLKEGAIVKELIEIAGGITEKGSTSTINLAGSLREGMCIIVPDKEALGNMPSLGVSSSAIGTSDIININSASREELKTLPGVGDVTADRIIEYREKHGGFKSKEEIKQVERIGEATYNKLKDKIDVR